MAVDENVNALDDVQQVDGAVAGGFTVNAQMPQTDDALTALRFQGVDLILRDFEHLLTGREGHTLDLAGVRLGGSLRGLQTEHADPGAIRGGEDLVVPESGFAVVQGVGGENGELGRPGELHQIVVAVVEFMVAQSGCVVAGQIHQFDSGFPLRGADGGITLNEVACVKEQDVSAAFLVVLLLGGDLGVSGDAAVDVVGVQNDNAAGEIGIRGSRGRLLCGAGGHGQRTGHGHCQEQGQELFHARSSFSIWVRVQ